MSSLVYLLDHIASLWFLSLRSDIGVSIFKFTTFFGSTGFIILSALVFCSYLVWQKRYGLLTFFAGGLIVNAATIFFLKILVNRPRPLLAVVLESDPSFPSGHTANSIFLFGFLLYYATKFITSIFWRDAVRIIGMLGIILIPISRLYLGEHYLTDVLASVILSSLILFVTVKWWEKASRATHF